MDFVKTAVSKMKTSFVPPFPPFIAGLLTELFQHKWVQTPLNAATISENLANFLLVINLHFLEGDLGVSCIWSNQLIYLACTSVFSKGTQIRPSNATSEHADHSVCTLGRLQRPHSKAQIATFSLAAEWIPTGVWTEATNPFL